MLLQCSVACAHRYGVIMRRLNQILTLILLIIINRLNTKRKLEAVRLYYVLYKETI